MPTLEQTPAAPSQRRGKRFVLNVFWNWLGVAATLISGLLVSPYLIRKLGPEAYGVWALSFALVEYYWFLDFGFRSAVVKYVAHHWATGEPEKINETVNTGLLYSAAIALLMFVAVLACSPFLHRFFQISEAYQRSFRILVALITFNWCLGVVFNTFGACLEAVQRFDLYTKSGVVSTTLRSAGTIVLLYRGYGLVEIGILVVATQALGYGLNCYYFRKIFPRLRIAPRYTSMATLKKMGRFGVHTFVANISNLFLNQSPPMLIGHFWPAAFVGYYTLPMRLIQYTGEAVGRIGIITNANTAELQARGESKTIAELAIYANRYCVMLFMPLAIVLWIYGVRLFELWVPPIARFSAPVLPVLLFGYMIAVIGQFSSGMLLQGLGRHQWYGRGLAAEAVVSFAALLYVVPRYGAVGAAWVVAAAMILNRGLFAPWLVSREMGFRIVRYLHSIYTWPFAVGVPVFALAWWLHNGLIPGRSWAQLFLVGCIVAAGYYALAYFACLPPHHRAMVEGWALRRWRRST